MSREGGGRMSRGIGEGGGGGGKERCNAHDATMLGA